MRAALFACALSTVPLAAQSITPTTEDLGTVTGHVTCADTQRPARFAQVRLVPADISPAKPGTGNDYVVLGGTSPVVQTDLSGAYIIQKVRPGRYYLRVDLAGYLTPLLTFSRDELASPTPEVQQRIQCELQLVIVAPNATLRAGATLQRSASISGTVRYDDGSPAIGLYVALLRRNRQGKFDYAVMPMRDTTDENGHYHLTSLTEGDYIVEADLYTTKQRIFIGRDDKNRSVQLTEPGVYTALSIYSGGVFRQRDAVPLKLLAGQELYDADITLPISNLHQVSGTSNLSSSPSPTSPRQPPNLKSVAPIEL